jgi:hypothetical protein
LCSVRLKRTAAPTFVAMIREQMRGRREAEQNTQANCRPHFPRSRRRSNWRFSESATLPVVVTDGRNSSLVFLKNGSRVTHEKYLMFFSAEMESPLNDWLRRFTSPTDLFGGMHQLFAGQVLRRKVPPNRILGDTPRKVDQEFSSLVEAPNRIMKLNPEYIGTSLH